MKDGVGCIATATGTVSQPPTVNVIVNTAGNNYNLTTTGTTDTIPACTGTTLSLYSNGATNYTWTPGGITANTITAPTTPTNYTLTAATGTCTTTYTFTTKINPPLTHSVTSIIPPMNPIYCTIEDTLTAYPQYGETYTWLPSNEIGTVYAPYLVVATCTSTTTYSVTNSLGGCIGGMAVLTLTINPAPTVSFSLVADATPHTWDAYPTYPANVTSYLWNWGDGTTSNTAYPSHTYSVAGTYSICVTVTDANGCTSTYCQNDAVSRLASNNNTLSNMVYVNVLQGQTTGISQYSNLNTNISVYPNPSNGVFNLQISQFDNLKMSSIEVHNLIGECVHSQIATSANYQIDLSSLQNGIYNISISSAAGVVNKRVVVSH